MRAYYVLVAAALIAMGVLGCSGNSFPLVPDMTADRTSSEKANVSHRDLWGWWSVSIDPAGWQVEIIPLRSAMFRANVTQWMQPPVGKLSNLKIDVVDTSTYLTDGRILVDVSLTHPFPGLAEYTGFDVNGVFINDGTVADSLDSSILYTIDSSSAAVLLNADGYTRWFNYPEFKGGLPILGYTPGKLGNMPAPSATLNPYKYFADGLGFNDNLFEFIAGNIAKRNVFSAGVTNKRRYDLQFSMSGGAPALLFQYAVAASWEPGDRKLSGNPDVWDVPGDFPISANQAEPFAIKVDSSDSTLYYENSTSKGGKLIADIEVFDWDALNPSTPLVEISKITLSACGSCNKYPIAHTLEGSALEMARVPGSGGPVSSVWHVEISGVAPAASGQAPFLVTVEPKNPPSYDQGFVTPIPDGHLAAYVLAWVNIGITPDCIPPTASAKATSSTDISIGQSVNFDASATTGTPPFTWHWDWNGDGAYDEQTTSPIISHQYNDAGTFGVMCKAVNACGEDAIDSPIQVNVSGCGNGLPTWGQYFQPATGGANNPYYFAGIAATINDPVPKLVAPGAFAYTTSQKKIYLALPSDPLTPVASWDWTGAGYTYAQGVLVDGTTAGIDRIFFCDNNTGNAPHFVDWNGTSFSNETTIPAMPSGSVYNWCLNDEGDVIAHNNIGPNTTVYLWDKQNNYAIQTLFQFQNTSASLPYGTLANIGRMGYDPETKLILFPVSNGSVSSGGQLYGFSLTGQKVFVDQNVFGTAVGTDTRIFSVTVDFKAPKCRVLFHGAPNNSAVWFARFTDGLTKKTVGSITNPLDNSGAKVGCLIGTDFWSNSNNWSFRAIRRNLPADW